MKTHKILILLLAFFTLCMGIIFTQKKVSFVLGGAFLDLGYLLQDRVEKFDFEHEDIITPEQVAIEFAAQNKIASDLRKKFPRHSHHPLTAVVICMDARLDTNEIFGDTRKYYYIIRTAGSVIKEKEQEMLELAVDNGVKLIVFTRHTDCAAEAIAADPAKRKEFPFITSALDERSKKIEIFLARPKIIKKIADGSLLIKYALIDTTNGRMTLKDNY